jgi:predicted TIM-barrel fold metal-dependent hydrolase
MADPVAQAQALIGRVHGELVAPLLPPDGRIWDAHAHLGEDDDGSLLDPPALLDEMRRFGVTRSFVFPFRQGSLAAYRQRNDAMIAAADASGGSLVPFCRVEPGKGAVAELERALDAGARGIKLHPLTGRFEIGDPLVDAAMVLAAERSVPVLLHAGRGIAPFMGDLERMLGRHPEAQVILAHAAIGDHEAAVAAAAAHPQLVFDVAVWNLLDLLALIARVAPEQILYGTDAPYYGHACVQAKLGLALAAAGAAAGQVAAILWDNAERVAAGRSADRLSPPVGGPEPTGSYAALRAHEYVLACVPLVWTRQPDLLDALRLAEHTVDPAASPRHAAAAEMLALARETWRHELETGSRREILSLSWTTFRLLEFADALILCP